MGLEREAGPPPGVNIAPAWEIGSAPDEKRRRDVLGMPGRGPDVPGACTERLWVLERSLEQSVSLASRRIPNPQPVPDPPQCMCVCVSVNVHTHTRTHLSLTNARLSVLPVLKSLEASVRLRDVNARGVYSLPPRKLRGCDHAGLPLSSRCSERALGAAGPPPRAPSPSPESAPCAFPPPRCRNMLVSCAGAALTRAHTADIYSSTCQRLKSKVKVPCESLERALFLVSRQPPSPGTSQAGGGQLWSLASP